MKKEMTRGGKSVVFILHGSGERGLCCCTELANQRNWPILHYCLRRLANIGHVDQYLTKLTNITAYLEFLEFS
jgi:hypothetical protein